MWWRLVGSAIEHAAKLHDHEIDFQKFFIKQEEEEDEDSVSLYEALDIMATEWPDGFHPTDVAELMNDSVGKEAAALRDFLYPDLRGG
jgi:hypothetical protein